MNKKEFAAINVKSATKDELLKALNGLSLKVFNADKDKNLLDRVKYTTAQARKSIRKVTLSDLTDLVSEVQAMLAPAPVAPVEAAKKPVVKSKSKKAKTEEPAEEEDSEETEEPAEEEVKKPVKTKKGGLKLSTPKTKASKELPVASMFPSELTIEADDGDKKLTCVHGKYHNMKSVREAIEEGKSLFIAAYWSKRHIKEYSYADTFHLDTASVPKSFPDDLDILNAVVACDNIDRLWAMSIYTEAMYFFDNEDFAPVEDEDAKTGDKFTVRVSNGMEFEVYECEEDAE